MSSQNWMLNNKKKILLFCLCSGLLLSWFTLKSTRLFLSLPCKLQSNSPERRSPLKFFQDVKLTRMLYDKPNTFKPQYVRFLNKFIESAEKFFMVGHKVNYYVFTDRANEISNFTLAEGRQLVILEVPAYERWQDVSMRRMEMIRDFSIKRFVNEVDYLACVDVDMVFLDYVGVEILSKVFGALHPGFFNKTRREFTYERRPQSSAYIPFEAGDFYYAGGYFGGVIEEVVRLTNYCHQAMMADKQKNMEALWHDESYLNKYFLLHKPTKLLSPEYIWNNYYGSPAAVQTKRFLGVDKNYKERAETSLIQL
ncbi:histo-blood group ABO system transferase-like isoform X3 [Hyla sarda]|uniref:histo-blood group ABO system transferase-like isoform X3 n=1 Tax=Hyla sarda TaxID=327740 RepID=UPI0024C3098F|nr:histo-blood group ABO system transferase-like isoform X3 [Hyla sarda]